MPSVNEKNEQAILKFNNRIIKFLDHADAECRSHPSILENNSLEYNTYKRSFDNEMEAAVNQLFIDMDIGIKIERDLSGKIKKYQDEEISTKQEFKPLRKSFTEFATFIDELYQKFDQAAEDIKNSHNKLPDEKKSLKQNIIEVVSTTVATLVGLAAGCAALVATNKLLDYSGIPLLVTLPFRIPTGGLPFAFAFAAADMVGKKDREKAENLQEAHIKNNLEKYVDLLKNAAEDIGKFIDGKLKEGQDLANNNGLLTGRGNSNLQTPTKADNVVKNSEENTKSKNSSWVKTTSFKEQTIIQGKDPRSLGRH